MIATMGRRSSSVSGSVDFDFAASVEGDGFSRLQEGQAVEYTEGKGPKGPRAENVKPV